MNKGDELCIPFAASNNEDQRGTSTIPNDSDLFNANSAKTYKRLSTIKAAVILPFMLDGNKRNESARMVEYYEGFLMAVDSLKRTGVSVDLYTYDSGDETSSI